MPFRFARNDSRANLDWGHALRANPATGTHEHTGDLPVRERCQCCDLGCPVHVGYAICPHDATTTLRRADGMGTCRMCTQCAMDALDSGLYRLVRE